MKTRFSARRQRGAALIVVLILMVMAVMLAVTGLQGGVTNEKLAGNYRAAALAQMVAETVASSRITRLDEAAGEQACRKIMDNDPRLSAWTPASLPEGDEENHQRAYYTACTLEGQPGYAITGEAVDAEGGVLARHRVIVAGTGGGGPDFDPPADLSRFSVLTKAERIIDGNGNTNVTGDMEENYGEATPSPVPGYMKAVRDYMGEVSYGSNGCATRGTFVFCDAEEGFSGTLDIADADSGKTFVIDGETAIKLNTQQDIDATFVSSGNMTFDGASKTQLTGLIWVGGTLVMNGTGNFSMRGSIVVAGEGTLEGKGNSKKHDNASAIFNGGLDLTGSDQTDMLKGSKGITWQEF